LKSGEVGSYSLGKEMIGTSVFSLMASALIKRLGTLITALGIIEPGKKF
jgi:hypothetical protein